MRGCKNVGGGRRGTSRRGASTGLNYLPRKPCRDRRATVIDRSADLEILRPSTVTAPRRKGRFLLPEQPGCLRSTEEFVRIYASCFDSVGIGEFTSGIHDQHHAKICFDGAKVPIFDCKKSDGWRTIFARCTSPEM